MRTVRILNALMATLLLAALTRPICAEEKSITGIIYGDEANEYGDLTSVVLVINEDALEAEYYSIVMDNAGQELLQELGNIVTVSGSFETRQDGSKWITVSKWERKKTNE